MLAIEANLYFYLVIELVKLVRKMQNNKIKTVNMQETIQFSFRILFRIVQILGMLPIKGIGSPAGLSFTFKSWNFFYTAIMMTGQFFFIILAVIHLIRTNFSLPSTVHLMLYTQMFLTCFFYVQFVRKLPKIITKWMKLDKMMVTNYGYPKNMNRNLHLVLFIFTSISALNAFIIQYRKIYLIPSGPESVLVVYHKMRQPLIWNYIKDIPGFIWIVHLHTILGAQCVYYSEAVIILFCMALTMRFKQINERVRKNQHLVHSQEFWKQIRQHYDYLSRLCENVITAFSPIIILGLGCNSCFMLIYFYGSIKSSNVLPHLIISFVIGRIIFLLSFAIKLNDESKKLAELITFSKIPLFNIEITRLLMQVSFDKIALSGGGLFEIRRGFQLGISGAIVSFELVLMQYHSFSGEI